MKFLKEGNLVHIIKFLKPLTKGEHREVHSKYLALQVSTNGCSLVVLQRESLAHDGLKGDRLS